LGWDERDILAMWNETREMALGAFLEERTLLAAHTSQGERTDFANFAKLSQADRAHNNGISLSSQKKLDHLAIHREDLLAAVQAGTLAIDKAYRLATGKVPETPVDAATRALARLTEAEQRHVVRALPGSDRQAHPTTHHLPVDQTPGRYITDLEELLQAGERFGTLYADPPWPYDKAPSRGAASREYPLLPLDQLAALPVRDLAADQAHLHLWVTNGFLYESKQILDAWGFTYVSNFVWVKPGRPGLGHYWRNSHELLLLGVRGGLTAQQKHLRSWLEVARRSHSEKPERVRDLVEQLSPGPYLELFGRAAVPGWTVFGNQQLPRTGRLFKAVIG
jgi:N6-adenosine-specific RNA methylase IME4